MNFRGLILAAMVAGCAGPGHQKYGAIVRTDVVTSVNGLTGAVNVGSVVYALGSTKNKQDLAPVGAV